MHKFYIICKSTEPKTKTVNLPRFILKIINKVDDLLISLSKQIFPLQRQLVLTNSKNVK